MSDEDSNVNGADQVSVAQAEFDSLPLKKKLLRKKIPASEINKFLAYVQGEKNKESVSAAKARREGKQPKTPVTNNTDDMLYTMFMLYWGLGLTIDGVNVVITGKSMAMVTYHGYKNKVRKSYPKARFDVQLVREGDDFSVGKETGRVQYTHNIKDPFKNGKIVGAYVFIRIGNDDYFESLNDRDYASMKGASKQSFLWDKWESEFWLKSVMKRACKRHFYDEVSELDELDNELYGAVDEGTIDRKIDDAIAERDSRIEIDDTKPATASPTPKPNVAPKPEQPKLY